MTPLIRFFLKSYPVQHGRHASAKTLAVCMLILTPLLGLCLAVGVYDPLIRLFFYLMIGLNITVLGLIRSGRFRPTVLILLGGYSISTTLCVFNMDPFGPHEIYMLTAAHLFILFIITLISDDAYYAYLSAGIALVSFWVHYIVRVLPVRAALEPSAGSVDDYLLCSGMVITAAMIITNTLKTKISLIAKLRRTAGENQIKADQITDLYEDLLRVVAEREEMEQKYRLLLETATDAIFIAQDGMIKFSNHRTVEMLGYSMEELTTIPFAEIIHQDDRDMVARHHKARLSGETPPPVYSFRGIAKNGETRWLRIHSVTTRWDQEAATLNFIQDITGHRQMEQQIQQSQKIEAIGTLASGIAHDFNNILSGIFAYLQLAQNHVNHPEKILRDIRQIRLGAEKAAELSRQILTVSRKSEPKKETFVMAELVKEALSLMRATLPATVEIREDLATRETIFADPGKIHQVVMNLCTNAFHAMSESGGVIQVSLHETSVHLEPGLTNGIPGGDYLILAVKDSGTGMDLETQEKIFDPYFTTKAPGKGTGLGLAVVLGIVKEHGGDIRLVSERGKGSEFRIFLPRSGPGDDRPDAAEPAALPEGKGHILFVDDEEDLCIAVRNLLKEQGYEVTCCRDGQVAWQTFEAVPEQFDLVLTDHVMPAMSGTELLRRIRKLSPQTPTILCTGNIQSIAESEQDLATEFIPKPLDAANLLRTIYRLTNPMV